MSRKPSADALGKFRDLWAHRAAPAMLFYLDNWLSSDPKPTSMSATCAAATSARCSSGDAARRLMRDISRAAD
jgi:uncharacterized protein (DUF1800 family)